MTSEDRQFIGDILARSGFYASVDKHTIATASNDETIIDRIVSILGGSRLERTRSAKYGKHSWFVAGNDATVAAKALVAIAQEYAPFKVKFLTPLTMDKTNG